LALLAAVNFLMIYTEWIGVFFSSVIFIYCLFDWRDKKKRIILALISISGLIAVALMTLQYSRIDGLANLLHYFRFRYLARSGYEGNGVESIFALHSWKRLFANYIVSAFLDLLLFIILLLRFSGVNIFRFSLKNIVADRKEQLFWGLCLLPIAIHHLAFFSFSAIHDFSVLKSVVFLSLPAGI